jgi:hypothetical protein
VGRLGAPWLTSPDYPESRINCRSLGNCLLTSYCPASLETVFVFVFVVDSLKSVVEDQVRELQTMSEAASRGFGAAGKVRAEG